MFFPVAGVFAPALVLCLNISMSVTDQILTQLHLGAQTPDEIARSIGFNNRLSIYSLLSRLARDQKVRRYQGRYFLPTDPFDHAAMVLTSNYRPTPENNIVRRWGLWLLLLVLGAVAGYLLGYNL